MSNTDVLFQKILVANRGEIAIRVLRAASELKLRTVAIYTYEDRYSLHRYKADEGYQIGEEDDPLKPYLDIDEIIRVAKQAGADAIHPGYGFLSENLEFAKRCGEAGIKFIGPRPESMAQLGDKVQAKILARKVNVPLIEDSKRPLDSVEVCREEAAVIGYPVMIKAASGGGGRGMRVVHSAKELATEYKEARSESLRAFGDDTVFLEKFIDQPKHIEVQIIGDEYGNLVHLFERDCSVQRRFQKVVEVAPSITLSESAKAKLYEYALNICKAADYSCAGTVEFLVDKDENIFFIEVNPRIQVEHTITEEITGIDIVRTQILIAMGHRLADPIIGIPNQQAVEMRGFAIQCRITTEDPANGFKPDYGTIIAYRSAAGFGIRLDAGSAYAGAVISPFFDSLLVKVTATGRTLEDAAQRLHRAIREFRVRGVQTNVGFLLNLLQHPSFLDGGFTVNFIKDHPELLEMPLRQDRGTKILRFLANTIVNGHPDVKFVDKRLQSQFRTPYVPSCNKIKAAPGGSKQRLIQMGRTEFIKDLRANPKIQYTDTTFRDAHQSLLATRMRTIDLMRVAESFSKHHGADLFSMEVWGGATFDVALRFLKEDPWERLAHLRKAIPNTLLQMLLRGSNAVGYTAYPDNLIKRFIVQAADTGIDVFRIFDSLNWIENMKVSIETVRDETDALAEACLCYTGDIANPQRAKFSLQYYVDLARRLEDAGAHILAIKDMAGLLKPRAATQLVGALREAVDLPIHLHTHDTSSIQSTTYQSAIDAGVDVVDVAIASMAGLTSQPNFNSIVAMLEGHERENALNLNSLNEFSRYWEAVRKYYYPFETELKAGTAEVYRHEIPGGQYSNLRPQARGLGLEEQFETIKTNYHAANELIGDIVKVTPSSKVVGDLAMFMTSNNLSKEDVLRDGASLSFPDSVKALMRGDLGQVEGGFNPVFQALVLKGEQPYTNRPNAHLEPIDFEAETQAFAKAYGERPFTDFLSEKLYPKVYKDYFEHLEEYGTISSVPTPAFYYGMEPNEEIMVGIEPGKYLSVEYLNTAEPDEHGDRLVFFRLNGQTRAVKVKDNSATSTSVEHLKATAPNEIGAPLQGNLSQVLVAAGDVVEVNTPLFVIEAMKMESTITSPVAGVVKRVHLSDKTMVQQDDLVIELEG